MALACLKTIGFTNNNELKMVLQRNFNADKTSEVVKIIFTCFQFNLCGSGASCSKDD